MGEAFTRHSLRPLHCERVIGAQSSDAKCVARLRRRARASDDARGALGRWCCQTGLNCRPLHYQWSALPLSYGSIGNTAGGSGQRAATKRGGSCHKLPAHASARDEFAQERNGLCPAAQGKAVIIRSEGAISGRYAQQPRFLPIQAGDRPARGAMGWDCPRDATPCFQPVVACEDVTQRGGLKDGT
jgi:hypothetical protein